MEDDTTIIVSCLCGGFRRPLPVSNSSLPLVGVLCHCSTCRHVSGVLCTSYARLPSTPGSVSGLLKYDGSSNLTRLFCGSCGAHVFAHLKAEDLWLLATGVLERSADPVKFRAHVWVGDTLDGGLSAWLPKLDGEEMVRYKRGSQSGELFSSEPSPRTVIQAMDLDNPAKLRGSCQCGGVQFYLTRPNATSKEATSPWPDLIAQYHTASPANPTDVKWWLRANNTKYLAGLCTCASCRRASGFDVQAWAFVPEANIVQQNETPLNLTTAMGSLRRYESSKGTYREFCGTCGATVFWHCDERPDVVDVSVGLLEGESGARVEEWLDWWTERVSFMQDARSEVLVGGLVHGLRAWGKEGGP